MNLEEMSAEVLLSKIYCRTENYQDVEQELLSRLAEGERAKEAMQKIMKTDCITDIPYIIQQYKEAGNVSI